MALSSFVQFPNGDLIDCQNSVLTTQGGSSIVVIDPTGEQYYSYASANPAAAAAVLMTISALVPANFVTFANGDIVDCQNCTLVARGDTNSGEILVISPKQRVFYSYAYDNVTDAQTALNGIATQVGANQTTSAVTLVQWNSGSGYQNLPVNITPGSSFSFQINGTNLPLNTEYIQVGGGPTWLQTAVSATQITTGNFAANLAAGTYDLQCFDISNNLLADYGNIITITSS